MQKIYFKKMVDLDHKLKELVSVSVDESINYKMETQGMRAVGCIMINGEFKDEEVKKEFHESIDLDILAQFDKIIDKRDFHIKVEDFDYSFIEGNLSLVIQTSVYGVKDDEDRVIETQERKDSSDEEIVDEIENLLREEEELDVSFLEEPVVETQKIQDIIETSQTDKVIVDKEEKEVSLEEDDDLGTYYLYIVQDGDSYQSIAARYQVDEYKLKDYNHERSLSKGAIVIVPYYS